LERISFSLNKEPNPIEAMENYTTQRLRSILEAMWKNTCKTGIQGAVFGEKNKVRILIRLSLFSGVRAKGRQLQ
jgi:hypothetical protein